jgi:hypothetical protein
MRVAHVLMGGPAILRSGLPAAALFRGCTRTRRSGKPMAGYSSGGIFACGLFNRENIRHAAERSKHGRSGCEIAGTDERHSPGMAEHFP